MLARSLHAHQGLLHPTSEAALRTVRIPRRLVLDPGSDLPEVFTRLYARLGQAIVMADADGIRSVSVELGVGEYYPLLAAMLTGRPWGDILKSSADMGARLQERGTAEDKAQIRGYASQYMREIVHVLERVPAPMLLLFKCNDCLRHAERSLGAGVNSFVITLRYCLQTLLLADEEGREEGREDADAAAAAAATDTDGAVAIRHASSSSGRSGSSKTGMSRLHRLRLRLAVWLLKQASGWFGPQLIGFITAAIARDAQSAARRQREEGAGTREREHYLRTVTVEFILASVRSMGLSFEI